MIGAGRDRAPIHLDVIGVGSSPYDFLKQTRVQIIGVNVAESATARDRSGRLRFFNLRSQLWWQLREALDPTNNTAIALPPDRRLLADLCAPRWELRGAAVFVESRDEIVKRIGRSPDYASAVILALIDTMRSEDLMVVNASNRRREHEPFEAIRSRGIQREHDPFAQRLT